MERGWWPWLHGTRQWRRRAKPLAAHRRHSRPHEPCMSSCAECVSHSNMRMHGTRLPCAHSARLCRVSRLGPQVAGGGSIHGSLRGAAPARPADHVFAGPPLSMSSHIPDVLRLSPLSLFGGFVQGDDFFHLTREILLMGGLICSRMHMHLPGIDDRLH